jgi:hypothetical protein
MLISIQPAETKKNITSVIGHALRNNPGNPLRMRLRRSFFSLA